MYLHMDKYLIVKNIVENNKCSLLTTYEEFEERRQTVLQKLYLYVRIEFIGLCGHNSSAVFTNFKSRKTGINCKECVVKSTVKTLKVRGENMVACSEIEIVKHAGLETLQLKINLRQVI